VSSLIPARRVGADQGRRGLCLPGGAANQAQHWDIQGTAGHRVLPLASVVLQETPGKDFRAVIMCLLEGNVGLTA
jgi:hypothetical protein